MLLNSRDRGRKIKLDLDESYPGGLSDSQKMALIQSFAYWMMENNLSDVEIERVDAHFTRRLPGMNLPKEVTGKQIRALFVERVALLREPAVGKIDFAHRTFQEFLAAQAALNEDSVNVLLEHAHNDQWREAIIVAAGLGRPRERKELLERLLQMGNEMPDKRHYLHLLAVACLETTVEVDPQIRTEVLKQAEALLPPKDDDEVIMVARAGDAIAPLLAPKPNYSYKETALCIQALAKIGSSAAMEILADYAKDTRYDLSKELGRAWDAFDRDAYAHKVLSHSNKVYVPTLVSSEGFEHLKHINELAIQKLSLKDLSPLQKLTNLTKLRILEADEICDLSSLAELSKLTHLSLGSYFQQEVFNCDTNTLAFLYNLTDLDLSNIKTTDCQFIKTLTQLTNLVLVQTDISELSLLANLTNLEKLNILEYDITDFSPLANLYKLTSLSIGAVISENGDALMTSGQISVINSLEKVYSLKNLSLYETKVKDITPLAFLYNLTNLELNNNKINDLSPLANLPNLASLTIAEAGITDISPLVKCHNLRKLCLGKLSIFGSHFFSSKTPVSDLSPLANLPNLTELVLGDTDVIDLSPLEGLPNLKIKTDRD